MYVFSHLSAEFADRLLFKNISVSAKKGKLYCLTGPNGSGKTTLLKKIRDLALTQSIRSLYFEQKVQTESGGKKSPGEQRYAGLMQLLHNEDDFEILLLDEPGNHLDSKAVENLFSVLSRMKAAVFLVTHDRRFLKRADFIYHLEDGKLEAYGESYESYREQRNLILEAQNRKVETFSRSIKKNRKVLHSEKEKQRKRTQKAEKDNRGQRNAAALIGFNRERADKTKSRVETVHKRKLQKSEQELQSSLSELRGQGRNFQLSLNESGSPARKRKLIEAQNFTIIYSGDELFQRLSFSLFSGEGVAVSGNNGSGKSSLLRFIADKAEKASGADLEYSGEVFSGVKKVFFLRQEHQIPENEKVIDYHLDFLDSFSEGEIRQKLSHAGFSGESVFQLVSDLSGGELVRLQLSRAMISGADLLLLDEPTNDLDEKARIQLLYFLKESKISYIIATHDFEFIEELSPDLHIHLKRAL